MANKTSLSNVLTFRVKQLTECCEKFKGTLDDLVAQIAESAHMWIDRCEDCDQQEYLDITVQLEGAVMWFIESTTKIESNLASRALSTGSLRTALSVINSPPHINFAPQGLDQSLQSLLERLDTLQNVTDMVQELKTDLDSCKSLMDSVEEMRVQIKNSTLQSEVQTISSNLQKVQKESDKYKSKQFLRLQDFEKKFLKMEQKLSKTDSQVKGVADFVNVFNECLGNSSEPDDQFPTDEKESKKIKIKSCKTLPDGLSKLVDRLSLLETASDNNDDTVKRIEEKLAELVAQTEQMKAQIALETDEREKGRNHIKAIREQLSALVLDIAVELDISDVQEQKLSTDERAQSMKDMCQALVKVNNGESSLSSQASAAECDEPRSEKGWTGFSVQCLSDISTSLSSGQIPWNVLSLGASGGFDAKTGVFTAPVDGMYLVIFVHFQTSSKPTAIALFYAKAGVPEKLIATRTTNKGDYDFDHCHIIMSAGDTIFLSLPKKDCCYQIPLFSCVSV
ncbi:hypothetical protein BsWGS_17473 [Bradybaena similaris]